MDKPDPKKIKAKLLADPNTAKIAEALGVGLDEYVQLILNYVEDPNLDPPIYIANDAELKSLGAVAPSTAEMKKFIESSMAVLDAAQGSGYQGKTKPLVAMPTEESVAKPLKAKEDAALKDALKQQLRNKPKKG